MSWRDAPLYVESCDLAAWVLERNEGWRGGPSPRLVERIADSATELVIQASLALTFPGSRAEHLERLDRGIVRLRTELRLAERLGSASPRQHRFAAERLAAIGRMVGGWRKRVERGQRRRERARQAARPESASTAAAGTDTQISGEAPPPAGA